MSETSEITRPLIDALNQTGGMAERMNSGLARKGRYTIHLHGKGTADILFFPRQDENQHYYNNPARPCWIETKIGKYGQNADQRLFQLKVEELGHRYILATSVQQGLDEALR